MRAGKKKLRVPRVLSFYQCYAIVPVKQHKKEHKGKQSKSKAKQERRQQRSLNLKVEAKQEPRQQPFLSSLAKPHTLTRHKPRASSTSYPRKEMKESSSTYLSPVVRRGRSGHRSSSCRGFRTRSESGQPGSQAGRADRGQ